MARRTSRSRRSTRRRRTRPNRSHYVVANRRSSRRRRLRRNLYGADLMKEVLVPVLGGTAGFVAARYLGNLIAMKDWGTTDPRTGKLIAAAVGIPATFMAARRMGASSMIAQHSGAIVLGMGLAPAEAYLRDTKLLGGSPAAAQLAPAPGPEPLPGTAPPALMPGEMEVMAPESAEASGDGLSAYYTQSMLGSLGDPADQSAVDNSMDQVEPVSTIIPTDTALRAGSWPQERAVTERFASPRGDRGHAGGVFARHLFSGMMGG